MSPSGLGRNKQEYVGTAFPPREDVVTPPRAVGSKLPHQEERGVVQIFFRFRRRSAVRSQLLHLKKVHKQILVACTVAFVPCRGRCGMLSAPSREANVSVVEKCGLAGLRAGCRRGAQRRFFISCLCYFVPGNGRLLYRPYCCRYQFVLFYPPTTHNSELVYRSTNACTGIML